MYSHDTSCFMYNLSIGRHLRQKHANMRCQSIRRVLPLSNQTSRLISMLTNCTIERRALLIAVTDFF